MGVKQSSGFHSCANWLILQMLLHIQLYSYSLLCACCFQYQRQEVGSNQGADAITPSEGTSALLHLDT